MYDGRSNNRAEVKVILIWLTCCDCQPVIAVNYGPTGNNILDLLARYQLYTMHGNDNCTTLASFPNPSRRLITPRSIYNVIV